MNYAALREVLEHIEADVSAAEFHGTLCAMLCTRSPPRIRDWLPEIVTAASGIGAAGVRLEEAGVQTQNALEAGNCELELLLPDDSYPLAERGAALAEWCEGFLFGLGLGAEALRRNLSEDGREIVADLLELSKLDAAGDEGADGEGAYTELVEYVRVGVLLIYEELAGRAGSDATPSPLH